MRMLLVLVLPLLLQVLGPAFKRACVLACLLACLPCSIVTTMVICSACAVVDRSSWMLLRACADLDAGRSLDYPTFAWRSSWESNLSLSQTRLLVLVRASCVNATERAHSFICCSLGDRR